MPTFSLTDLPPHQQRTVLAFSVMVDAREKKTLHVLQHTVGFRFVGIFDNGISWENTLQSQFTKKTILNDVDKQDACRNRIIGGVISCDGGRLVGQN